MDWLYTLLSIVIAILLAICGWRVITRIAKRREAYDLSSSLVDMLEKVEREAINAWEIAEDWLDEYTELRLTTLIAGIEFRLKVLRKHYHRTSITDINLVDLRRLATMTKDLLHADGERSLNLHKQVTDMITLVLEDNYNFINAVKKSV